MIKYLYESIIFYLGLTTYIAQTVQTKAKSYQGKNIIFKISWLLKNM